MSFTSSLALTLYVGAANHDATPEQRQRLRETVMPEMRQVYAPTGDESTVRAAVLEVMGADWAPSGDWKRQIDALEGS